MSINDSKQEWLDPAWLPIRLIINIARGAGPSGGDPISFPPDWKAIHDDLRACVERREIESVSRGIYVKIRADGFWKFLSSRGHVAEGLQDAWVIAESFCERWAENHGMDLSIEPAKVSSAGLTQDDRAKGGKVRTFDHPFQVVICEIRKDVGGSITKGKFVQWMRERDATSAHPYSFKEDRHLDCYGIYLEGDIVTWKNKEDVPKELRVNSLRPYFDRANGQA